MLPSESDFLGDFTDAADGSKKRRGDEGSVFEEKASLHTRCICVCLCLQLPSASHRAGAKCARERWLLLLLLLERLTCDIAVPHHQSRTGCGAKNKKKQKTKTLFHVSNPLAHNSQAALLDSSFLAGTAIKILSTHEGGHASLFAIKQNA